MFLTKLFTVFIFTAATSAPIVALPVPWPPLASPKPANSVSPVSMFFDFKYITYVCNTGPGLGLIIGGNHEMNVHES